MGRNEANVSLVSWKVWRILRDGRRVTASWGPATLVKRKVKFKFEPQSKTWSFRTEAAAIRFVNERIDAKLHGKYERRPRSRRAG